MVHSIPFVDANRDDDARSCPGPVVHASDLHPNHSHRLSYLVWKISDKTENTTREKHDKNEQAGYVTRHSSRQKSSGFSVDLRDQTACFARLFMLLPFASAASSEVSQTPRKQRLVLKYLFVLRRPPQRLVEAKYTPAPYLCS